MTDTFRILVTGSRNHDDPYQVRRALQALVEMAQLRGQFAVVVHGDCPSGVDFYAAKWCEHTGTTVEAHPAQWDTHGKAAGPLRNQKMVDLGADVCIAFPVGESRGTRDCMARAEKAGIPVFDMTLRQQYNHIGGQP